jgi:hypothetical protein
MHPVMHPESAAVHEAFIAAFGPYVEEAIAAREIQPPPGWIDALARGTAWLDDSLSSVLRLPLGQQRRSPLEVFQEALRFPTEAIAATGRPPSHRDEASRRALPGDVYDLAPASSQALGEPAWRAHLAWGVAKAREVAGAVGTEAAVPPPRRASVALVGTDLMDRSRVEPVVSSVGLHLDVWRNPGAIEAGLGDVLPVLVLVDLTHPAADEAIASASAAGVRTVAFGPHVDDVALVRAKSLGASDALARSRFFRRLPEMLPRQA